MSPEIETLTKREAIEFLGFDEKLFNNYFSVAKEFNSLERQNGRGRFHFNKAELKEWLNGYKWRTVDLTKEDYLLCLDFALAMHFRGYVRSDFGTGRQREFGQKITNWVKGQLGEVAVKKFLKNEFDVDVELDFNIHGEIVPQDIVGVIENGRRREPRIGVAIKSSKPKNAYLILAENEITREERRSDVYIFCRPDIPDDHLLRLTRDTIIQAVRNEPHFSSYENQVPEFENIPCEIAGFCRTNELETVDHIPGQDFENGLRYVKQSGLLHKKREDWEQLLTQL